MPESKLSVFSSKLIKTKDEHPLKLDAKFTAESSDITVTVVEMQMDAEGQIQTGERAKSFEAVITLGYPKKEADLVYHASDPANSRVIENAVFVVPGTVIDGFWLREHESTKEAMKEAAFEQGISAEIRDLLQPVLDSVTQISAKIFSQLTLEECAEKKSGGLLSRRPTEYHLDFKELNMLFRQEFVQRAKPTLPQVLYCIGRHGKSLKQEWNRAVEKYGAPKGISQADLDSDKWGRRFAVLQEADFFTPQQSVNWRRVDHVTKGGKYLDRFIEKLFKSPKFGLEGLIKDLKILTPDSTEEKWWIASMARLLYYYQASIQQSRKQDG